MLLRRTFFSTLLAFIVFTVVGALSHEYGHIAVAKMLGYKTELRHASMNYNIHESDNSKWLGLVMRSCMDEIQNDIPFPEKDEYLNRMAIYKSHSLWVRLGGPIQTMLTGTIGLIILLVRRKQIKQVGFQTLDWFAVLLSLFWIRQVANLSITVVSGFLTNDDKFFGGDEAVISYYLNLPSGTVSIITGILGFVICTYSIFWLIPKNHRFSFILGGLAGGSLGYVLWMQILGPILLP